MVMLLPLLVISQVDKERTSSIQIGLSFVQFKDYYTYDLKSFIYSIEWGSNVLGTDGRLYVQSKLNRIHEITHPKKNLKWDGWEVGIASGFELLV